jgi:hypothetical protein
MLLSVRIIQNLRYSFICNFFNTILIHLQNTVLKNTLLQPALSSLLSSMFTLCMPFHQSFFPFFFAICREIRPSSLYQINLTPEALCYPDFLRLNKLVNFTTSKVLFIFLSEKSLVMFYGEG